MDHALHKASQAAFPGKLLETQITMQGMALSKECSWALYLMNGGKERSTGERGQFQQRLYWFPESFAVGGGPLELSRVGTRGLGLLQEPPCLLLDQSKTGLILAETVLARADSYKLSSGNSSGSLANEPFISGGGPAEHVTMLIMLIQWKNYFPLNSSFSRDCYQDTTKSLGTVTSSFRFR